MKMLKNPNVKIERLVNGWKGKSSLASLSMAGLWGWKEVEAALIGISVDQVFSVGDDGFNYLTRFAFYGRKQSVSRLLDMLKDEGERLRASVGEGAKSKEENKASRDSSRGYQRHPRVWNRMENRMAPGSDVNDKYRIFHHLLHLCAQQDVRLSQDSSPPLDTSFGTAGTS